MRFLVSSGRPKKGDRMRKDFELPGRVAQAIVTGRVNGRKVNGICATHGEICAAVSGCWRCEPIWAHCACGDLDCPGRAPRAGSRERESAA